MLINYQITSTSSFDIQIINVEIFILTSTILFQDDWNSWLMLQGTFLYVYTVEKDVVWHLAHTITYEKQYSLLSVFNTCCYCD